MTGQRETAIACAQPQGLIRIEPDEQTVNDRSLTVWGSLETGKAYLKVARADGGAYWYRLERVQ